MVEKIIEEINRYNNIINAFSDMVDEKMNEFIITNENGERFLDISSMPLEAKTALEVYKKELHSNICKRNAYMDVFPEKGAATIWPTDKDGITMPRDAAKIINGLDANGKTINSLEYYYLIAGTYVKADKELSVEEYKQQIINTCTELMRRDPAFAGKNFSDLQQAVEDARDKNRTL